MQQQQARMHDANDLFKTAEDRLIREYRRLVERFPGELTGETRVEFEEELGRLMPKGIYRDTSGEVIVRVVDVALQPQFARAIDAHVEYTVMQGSLTGGKLPALFFLEMHRFVRMDAASL